MNNRQEYLKKYRLEHKEKYREYQRKYKKIIYLLMKNYNKRIKN